MSEDDTIPADDTTPAESSDGELSEADMEAVIGGLGESGGGTFGEAGLGEAI